MPSTRSFFHKNRSQASLLSTQESNDKRSSPSYHASPIDSPLHSPRFPSSSAVSPEGKDDEDDYNFGQPSIYRPDETRYHHPNNSLARSQSQRSPPGNPANHQPTINLVGSPVGHSIEANPDSYYLQALPAAPQQKEDSKRRRFFKLGSSSTKEPSYHPPQPATRLGRSVSVKRQSAQVPTDLDSYRQQAQQRWPSQSVAVTLSPQPIDVEAEVKEDHTLRRAHIPSHEVGPPIPAKDLIPSPQHPHTPTQEAPYGKPPLQGVVTNIPQRHPYERQSSVASLWETRSFQESPRAPSETFQRSTVYQTSPSSGVPSQLPQSYHSSPASATSTSSHPLPTRGLQDFRHQYRYEQQRDRPPSQQSSYEPPSPMQPGNRVYESHNEKQGSNRSSLNAYTTTNSMGPPPPPPSQQPQGRNSNEIAQQNQQQGFVKEGSGYQPYSQGVPGQSQSSNASNQYDTRLNVNQQNQQYRGTPQPSPLPAQATSEGRSTPPPSRSRDDLSNLDVSQLVSRHDELREFQPRDPP